MSITRSFCVQKDVWFSTLTQLNAYINAYAEELRHLFVEHEGQKQLTIKVKNREAGGDAKFGVN
jgi:hypothetical protein